MFDGFADGALAPLEAVVGRGVDDVDAEFDGAPDGVGVGAVGLFVRAAEVRADADGGEPEVLLEAEVPFGGRLAEAVAVRGGAFGRGVARQSHKPSKSPSSGAVSSRASLAQLQLTGGGVVGLGTPMSTDGQDGGA